MTGGRASSRAGGSRGCSRLLSTRSQGHVSGSIATNSLTPTASDDAKTQRFSTRSSMLPKTSTPQFQPGEDSGRDNDLEMVKALFKPYKASGYTTKAVLICRVASGAIEGRLSSLECILEHVLHV